MNPKDKHCTPEQAETLEKSGLKITTENEWWIWDDCKPALNLKMPASSLEKMSLTPTIYSAPDVPEIMSIIPTEIETEKGTAILWINRTEENEYEAGYVFDNWQCTDDFSAKEHLAHTLMDLLLWCIDNRHLKVEDIKL